MLIFEKQGPKEWRIKTLNKDPHTLKLMSSSVTNKYYLVADYIKRLSEFHGQEFSDWLVELLEVCKDESKRSATIIDNIDKIKLYSNSYLDFLDIDYTKFVDRSKSKKNSILFLEEEIKEIIKLSCYLKLYSLISNSVDYSLGVNLHKVVYNKFAQQVIDTQVASKIFDVVKTKTFRYNLTDKFMWDYIKTIQCKDINIHIIEIFNFIMNNIIILCEEDKNPITYFVGVIDESVKWFLRSVYKGSIIYEDEISTEDIHGVHINNLRTYSFNDTLGKLKAIAFEKIYERLDQENVLTIGDTSDQYIIDFNNRLSSIEYISPLCPSLVYPILSKITNITYVHFKTISPEHSAVLSFYLNRLLTKVFKMEYQNLFYLLDFYPESQPSLSTTYRIKIIHDYINTQDKVKDFFGFNTKIFPYNAMCHFIGRVSRINFTNLLTGQKLSGIPLSKVESDMVQFYTNLFSGNLQPKIDEMIKLSNQDF